MEDEEHAVAAPAMERTDEDGPDIVVEASARDEIGDDKPPLVAEPGDDAETGVVTPEVTAVEDAFSNGNNSSPKGLQQYTDKAEIGSTRPADMKRGLGRRKEDWKIKAAAHLVNASATEVGAVSQGPEGPMKQLRGLNKNETAITFTNRQCASLEATASTASSLGGDHHRDRLERGLRRSVQDMHAKAAARRTKVVDSGRRHDTDGPVTQLRGLHKNQPQLQWTEEERTISTSPLSESQSSAPDRRPEEEITGGYAPRQGESSMVETWLSRDNHDLTYQPPEGEDLEMQLPEIDADNRSRRGQPPPTIPATTRDSSGLVVARPVSGESRWNLQVAEQVEDNEDASQGDKKVQSRRIACLLVALMVIVLITVSVQIGGKSTPEVVTEVPTADEQGMSSGPEEESGEEVEIPDSSDELGSLSPIERIELWLPSYTRIQIDQSPNSPQAKAYNWTIHDPNLFEYPDWRVKQRFALATFFFSTNGPHWFQSNNWTNYDVHECLWGGFLSPDHHLLTGDQEAEELGGVIDYFFDAFNASSSLNFCLEDPQIDGSSMEIQALTMAFNALVGTLPPELELLEKLKMFVVFYENIKGSIPTTIGRLTELKLLAFSTLLLTGMIPTEIGLLTDLAGLSVSSVSRKFLESDDLVDYRLIGTIPTQVGQLKKLRYLWLHANKLTGPLPSEMGHLSQLKILEMHDNTLSGSIPSELGSIGGLTKLHLSINRFLSGTIPTQLGLLRNASQISLCCNQLEGQIPSELGMGTNTNLWKVNVGRNKLTGTIPTQLTQIPNLVDLGLGVNMLTGTIPSQLGLLSFMKSLSLWDNQLEGSMPTEVGLLSRLAFLDLDINQLSGTLPTTLSGLTRMTDLYIRDNVFSGTLPTWMGLMTRLRTLFIHTNLFEGPLPSELGLLRRLELIWAYNNSLTGSIPKELGSLVANESLQLLPIDNNKLTGTIPEALCSLGMLDESFSLERPSTDYVGLSFDCDADLCGCDWCLCGTTNSTLWDDYDYDDGLLMNHSRRELVDDSLQDS